jgi:peptidoglycan/LPS O-acetylase OafA/YrhL
LARRTNTAEVREPDLQGHLPALDGLRGLAIVLVFLYHATIVTPGAWPETALYQSFRNFGWCGVDLFFVLSGFLITGLLYDSKGGQGYFRNFYARRFLRIFPLYYGYLFLVLVVAPRLHAATPEITRVGDDAVWFWVYLNNFPTAIAGDWEHSRFLGHLWSLAIEEQFYLVWPFFVLACSRRTLMIGCAAVIVVSPLLRAAFVAADFSGVSIYVMTPTRLDSLAMGALVALVARGEGGVLRLVGPAKKLGLAALVGVAVLCAWQSGFGYALPLTSTLGLSLVALLSAALLTLAVGARPGAPISRLLCARSLRGLGRISYAVYVFHQAAIVVSWNLLLSVQDRWLPSSSLLTLQLLLYAVAGAVAVAAALTSWEFFERPILSMKRYFPAPHRPGRRLEAKPATA